MHSKVTNSQDMLKLSPAPCWNTRRHDGVGQASQALRVPATVSHIERLRDRVGLVLVLIIESRGGGDGSWGP